MKRLPMGFRVSWIARPGTSTVELLDLSHREPTGERHDFPDVGWYLLELSTAQENQWVVLIADGSDSYMKLDARDAQRLSKDGSEALYFTCSDTVMATDLVHFKNGVEGWSVRYSCEDNSRRPALHGDVPQIAYSILEDLQSQQQPDDGADYIYDMTAELGRKLVGFRHDSDLDTDDPEPFQVLRKAAKPAPRSRSWWQVWSR
jgi:hypothetical protein